MSACARRISHEKKRKPQSAMHALTHTYNFTRQQGENHDTLRLRTRSGRQASHIWWQPNTVSAAPIMSRFSKMAGGRHSCCIGVGWVYPSSASPLITWYSKGRARERVSGVTTYAYWAVRARDSAALSGAHCTARPHVGHQLSSAPKRDPTDGKKRHAQALAHIPHRPHVCTS